MSKRHHDRVETKEERRERKRKSRWQETDKAFIPGMPTQIPSNLTKEQEQMYINLTRKLKIGDLGIPEKPENRSPSPEPIYGSDGKRLNTREYRTRKRMEDERHALVQKLLDMNPEFKPPIDYRPPQNRITDKVFIPQEEHPHINFVGLLIGPRGNTLKALEKDTGAKVIIRGKGSVKDGKLGRLDGLPMPGEDEPLHAYVQANQVESVQKAVEKIKQIIKEGVEVPEGQNDLRKAQLRELALLNGTLRENEGLAKLRAIAESQNIATNAIICSLCGGAGHISTDCKVNSGDSIYSTGMIDPVNVNPAERAKMDSEYSALMTELGVKGNKSTTGRLYMFILLLASKPTPVGAPLMAGGSVHGGALGWYKEPVISQPPPPGVEEDTPASTASETPVTSAPAIPSLPNGIASAISQAQSVAASLAPPVPSSEEEKSGTGGGSIWPPPPPIPGGMFFPPQPQYPPGQYAFPPPQGGGGFMSERPQVGNYFWGQAGGFQYPSQPPPPPPPPGV